jgi:hypothetical protein
VAENGERRDKGCGPFARDPNQFAELLERVPTTHVPPFGEHLLLAGTPFLHEPVVGKAPMLVGCADEQIAAWPHYAQGLRHSSIVIGNMFEDIEHSYSIE